MYGKPTLTVSESETTEATVKKVWDDENDKWGARPESLEVTLSDGTEVTLNEGNGWTATVEDLPKYDDAGEEIKYTWDETEVPAGYELSGTSVEGTVTTLTDTFQTKDVTFYKDWYFKNYYIPEERVPYNYQDHVILDMDDFYKSHIKLLVESGEGEPQPVEGATPIIAECGESALPEDVQTKVTELNKVADLNGSDFVSSIYDTQTYYTIKFEGLPEYDENGNECTYSLEESYTVLEPSGKRVVYLPMKDSGDEVEFSVLKGTATEGNIDGSLLLYNGMRPSIPIY